MRKAIFTIIFLSLNVASAQNLQLHYDFGHAGDIKRYYLTSTFEFFKPDSLGSTYMFIDIDFAKGNGGALMAYGEISRKFTLHKKSGLSLHIEYNDGTPTYITPAFLTGFSYPIKIGKFTLNTSLLYKAYQKAKSPDGQLTLVWKQTFLKSKFLFCGFLDIWTQDNVMSANKKTVFLTEPQLWFLVTRQLRVGSEVEISRNFFVADNKFKFMPTLAVRWDF